METKTRGFVFGILTGLSREKRVLLTGHSDQFSFEESPISATEMNITTMLNVSSTTSVGDANLEELAFWIYYFTMLFFVSIFTIVGNLLVIQAMVKNDYGVPTGGRRHRHLRTPPNYFLFSLAISDLLLGIVYPIYNVSHIKHHKIKQTLGLWASCDVILTTTLALLSMSSFSLVGITITRYISIRDPLKFPLHFTHRRALAAVVTTWVFVIAISCASYVRNAPVTYNGECRYEEVLMDKHIIMTTCFYVLLPLVIMTSLNGHMAVIARRQIRIIVSQQVACGNNFGLTQQELVLRKEIRMFKMTGTLLGYFAFAWMPFVIFEFTSILGEKEINKWIRATVRIILHSNTAVNVMIYAGSLRCFREAIKSNLRDCLFTCGLRSKS